MDRSLASPKTIYLKDYTPPAFLIDAVDLHFILDEKETRVINRMQMRRNPASEDIKAALVLDGEEQKLNWVALDGEVLDQSAYDVDDKSLTIPEVPDKFEIYMESVIHPENNTSLEGLYKSSGNFCTQCEAEGFRKITYYLDRPDVMSEFTTTVEADKKAYPVLLSNGNPVESGELDDNRHFVRWHDPFKKPSYLFALVAGDLALTEDSFTTMSGRKVQLRIYTEHHNADKTAHAMQSLKNSMRWDEQNYGREYDLDIYMIVAVDDFNMGAMENKGLNVFNSKYVLALPDTATDADYVNIEGVIGHEYFHNWTGNRITCRDWFQLSLKEGLTVFRDQTFTADRTSESVKRIDDVRILRTHQFAEDASPMAHPVRPASYMEINNFYTVTVYNKGAEVVRMYRTLLGMDGFRKGMDLYFQRHDGQAVTTDDFRQAMADANDFDLGQFQRWYDQAGTPELTVTDEWNQDGGIYTLHVSQSCPPTPEQENKEPFVIPLRLGLLGTGGYEMPLCEGKTDVVLTVNQEKQHFNFGGLPERPVPSMLRQFSAPVKLKYDYSDEQLAFLMGQDKDPFNRWDAGQTLALRVLKSLVEDVRQGRELQPNAHLREAVKNLLTDKASDPALRAEALLLPLQSYIAEEMDEVNPAAIYLAREFVRRDLAEQFKGLWQSAYKANQVRGEYRPDPSDIGKRRLKNIALGYLTSLETPDTLKLAQDQFKNADNMTDSLGALGALSNIDCPEREQALKAFYERWQDNPLVLDNWFSLQAMAVLPDTLEKVKGLLKHPKFSLTNPNRVRALIGSFAHANPVCFHAADGEGYRFVSDRVLDLDAKNPQVAARLAKAFTRWRKYDVSRQEMMRAELERLKAHPGLSSDTYEIVDKSLV